MSDTQYFWCLAHDTVEEGVGCRAAQRMGPYPSPEAARAWRETHEGREDRWEEQDEEWQEG